MHGRAQVGHVVFSSYIFCLVSRLILRKDTMDYLKCEDDNRTLADVSKGSIRCVRPTVKYWILVNIT